MEDDPRHLELRRGDVILRKPLPFIALLTLSLPATVAGQEDVDAVVARVAPEIIELRHQIHQNPELGNREFETAELVAEHLRGLGFEVETDIAHTGVVAVLEGGRPGPVVAVRADMDALPVTEATDLPFRSTERSTYNGKDVGVAHACGHDIHTAVQLGVASVLAEMRDEIAGTVKFLFQPAEEGAPAGEEGGARLMIAEGALDEPRPERIFALHSVPFLDVGQVGWIAGTIGGSSDSFIVTITGKQAHGAWPHESIDPVVTAAQAVLALQTIRSRNIDPIAAGVVSVGVIEGGTRHNIIPGSVRLEGTIRTHDMELRDKIIERMHEILSGITQSAGASYEMEVNPYAPPLVNEPGLAGEVRPILVAVVGEENVIDQPADLGAEDFAYYAQEVSGFYYNLGVLAPGTTSGGLHTPTFRGDDSAIPVGMRVMTNLVLEYLNGEM